MSAAGIPRTMILLTISNSVHLRIIGMYRSYPTYINAGKSEINTIIAADRIAFLFMLSSKSGNLIVGFVLEDLPK